MIGHAIHFTGCVSKHFVKTFSTAFLDCLHYCRGQQHSSLVVLGFQRPVSGRHSDLAYLIVRIHCYLYLQRRPRGLDSVGISQERGLGCHGRGAGNCEGLLCMACQGCGTLQGGFSQDSNNPKFNSWLCLWHAPLINYCLLHTPLINYLQGRGMPRTGRGCLVLAYPTFRPFIIMEEGIN